MYVELNALIDARNNDKISEADRFTILGGKFFIKLPQLLRPQPRVRATDRNLNPCRSKTIVC